LPARPALEKSPEFRSYNTAWGLAWWLHNYIPTCMLQHVLENTRACDAARRPARL
jgi:hypothetical protein